jgi:Gram-negative bacterial tonB protein.
MKLPHVWLPLLTLALFTSGNTPVSAQTNAPAGQAAYELSAVDKAPVPKRRIRPDFPNSLRKRDTPAEITLRFIVTAEGRVENITIVRFDDPDMVEPAYIAYEKARFEPGEKDGQPVATRMEVTEIFPEPKAPRKERK